MPSPRIPAGLLRAIAITTMIAAASPCAAQVFYEIVAPDGSRDWLLGTIHSEDPRVLDFPPVLEQALRQVDAVALELVPDREMLDRLDRAVSLPPDERLSERIPPALYRRVAEALIADGLSPEEIQRLRPWAAAMTLAQPPAETGHFMDLAVAARAMQHGAAVRALETVDEQIEFFAGLDDALELDLLAAAVEDHGRRAAALDALVAAYLEGDLAGLRKLAEAPLAEVSPALLARFRHQGLAERNLEMVRRAEPMLARGALLIGVGALHLAGERGLVALLVEQGYEVRPIY